MKFKLLSIVVLMAVLLGMSVQGFAQMQQGASPALSVHDQQFMARAAQDNRAEIMLGRLALERSSDPQVRALAERMVQEHTTAQSQLERIAADLEIVLPIEPSAQQQADYTQLSALAGQAFDRAYLQQVKRWHEQSIALHQAELTEGSDPQVISYASSQLPTLQTHLASVEQQIIAMERQPWQAQPQRQTIRGFW